jgi:hypothetical protein
MLFIDQIQLQKSRFAITNSFPSTIQCKQFYCVRIDEWMNYRKSTKQLLIDENLRRLIHQNCSKKCDEDKSKKTVRRLFGATLSS